MSTPDTPAEPVVLRELGWGLREVLHWLIDRVTRPLAADAPTADEVHAAVDAVGLAGAHPVPETAVPVPEPDPEPPAPEPPSYGGL